MWNTSWPSAIKLQLPYFWAKITNLRSTYRYRVNWKKKNLQKLCINLKVLFKSAYNQEISTYLRMAFLHVQLFFITPQTNQIKISKIYNTTDHRQRREYYTDVNRSIANRWYVNQKPSFSFGLILKLHLKKKKLVFRSFFLLTIYQYTHSQQYTYEVTTHIRWAN